MESRTKKQQAKRRQNQRRMMAGTVILFFVLIASIVGIYIGVEKPELRPGWAGPSATPASANAARPTPTPPASLAPTPALAEEPKTTPPAVSTEPTAPTPTPPASPPAAGAGGAPATGTEAGRVKLAFVGDVLLGSTVENVLKEKGYDYPYSDVKTLLQGADLTIANLETPVTERGTPQQKDYVYRSSPKALPAFKEAGFDLVNLANNHSMDQGEQGLLDTMDHLDVLGIKRVGAGRTSAEAFRPVILESKGIRIAFVGFTRNVPDNSWKAGTSRPGLADTYDSKAPVDAIRKAREQADLVVVIAHWGVERSDTPDEHQKKLARAYIDAGADLIIGGHPHVLQGFERYQGKWIAYSLGNFIFTTNNYPKTLDSMILEASCSKERSCELKMVPIFTKWAHPVVMGEADSLQLFQRLTAVSTQAAIGRDGRIRSTVSSTSP
ncbi:hypothetical protein J31TS4_13410 [Paenibacillus sp. J31TS4]|uniref:CapA family protein n=1 Tax=Paenibacillus sp. J31TS4 TaxID=2807195 RepID=UPI001B135645|nr:CapA family protein [Paenibacillus sp. J31TS4]GIP38061.1 hypothetical protein J31TS4_13410 [Paenibacillus sp. J31TS4]